MRALAFANHAPDELIIKLRGNKIDRKLIQIVGEETRVKRQSKCEHFVFLSVAAFHHNVKRLEELEGICCYVFDDPMALSQYNLTPADFVMEEDFHIDGFSLLPTMNLDAPEIVPTRTQFNVVEYAKTIAKQQITFLNQFMTFIYSMPSETHQKPIKELVCKWMASKESLGQYCKRITKLRTQLLLTDKQVNRLQELVTSPVAELYRKALQLPGDEDEIARTLKVSAFELRYIRAINRGQK